MSEPREESPRRKKGFSSITIAIIIGVLAIGANFGIHFLTRKEYPVHTTGGIFLTGEELYFIR